MSRTTSHRRLLRMLCITAVVAAGPLFASGQARANPIQVDSAADNLTPGDGLCTLREAIDNANWDIDFTSGDCEPGLPGIDTIEIQPGLPPFVLTLGELEIRKTMKIVGPPSKQEISGGGVHRVLHLRMDLDPAGTHDYHLENLRIIDGFKSAPSFGSPPDCAGRSGGLCMASIGVNVFHRARLRNLEFRNNQSHGDFGDGGAAYFGGNVIDVEITETVFDDNEAGGAGNNGGGAYFNGVDRVQLSNVRFIGNDARGFAGALVVDNANSLSITNSDFSSNRGRGNQPSAIAISNTDQVFILNTTVRANLNVDSGLNLTRRGYALRLIGGSTSDVAVLSNLWVDQNLGCGLGVFGMQAHISGSTFSRNQCDDAGAGLGSGNDATLSVTASSVLDNINPLPPIVLDGGTFTLESTTVAANHATTAGQPGGIRLDAGTLNLRNTILADNAGSQGSFQRVSGTVNASYSQFGDPSGEINGTSSNNLFVGSTNLGPFGDYGCATKAGDSIVGPTVCVQMRPLSTNSQARDQGDGFGAAYDQRGLGFTRTEGVAADIGAYEFQPPSITIEAVDAVKAEGNSGNTPFQFRVLRNGDLRAESWAAWNVQGIAPNPADAGDFTMSSWLGGNIYFAPNQSEVMLVLDVIGDTNAEPNEDFSIHLGALTNGTPGANFEATGRILNDDAIFAVPTLSIARLEGDVAEGQYFYSTHRFRVTRSQVTSGYCSADVRLSGGGLFPAGDDDFFDVATGVLNRYQMGPGTTHFDVEIRVAGDGMFEADEGFSVSIENPGAGCFLDAGAASAASTIVNDDSTIWIEVVTSSAPEGTGSPTSFSFMIHRGMSDLHAVSVQYSVSGVGANPASASDFAGGSFPSGTVTFAPGQSEALLVVSVAGDAALEPDETFRVTLSAPQGGDIYPTGSVDATILNDDGTTDLIFENGFE